MVDNKILQKFVNILHLIIGLIGVILIICGIGFVLAAIGYNFIGIYLSIMIVGCLTSGILLIIASKLIYDERFKFASMICSIAFVIFLILGIDFIISGTIIDITCVCPISILMFILVVSVILFWRGRNSIDKRNPPGTP